MRTFNVSFGAMPMTVPGQKADATAGKAEKHKLEIRTVFKAEHRIVMSPLVEIQTGILCLSIYVTNLKMLFIWNS